MKKIAFYGIVAILLLASSTNLYAADIAWNVDVDGLWSNTGNWTGGVLPGAADIALFDNPANSGVTVTIDISPTIDRLYVGLDAGTEAAPIELTITGGANTLAATGLVGIAVGSLNTGHGKLTILDGTYNLSQWYIAGWDGASTGVIDQLDGTINVTGASSFSLAHLPGTKGTYNLSGGTLNLNTHSYIGYQNIGVMTVSQPTAVPTVFNTTQDIRVGNDNGSNGTLNVTGGVTTSNNIKVGYAAGSTGTFTQQGGTINVGTFLWIGERGTGSYYLEGGSVTTPELLVGTFSGSDGTFEMSGGTMNIGNRLRVAYQNCTSNILLTGGTITTPYVQFFENSVGTANFEVDGARLEIGNSGIIQNNGALGAVNLNLGSGTIAVAAGSTGWSTSLPATLTGDGLGNDITFEIDDGKLINWNGDLTGTGGLRIDNLGATAWDVTRNYSYTGDTTIVNGAIDLTNTGVNKGVLSSNRIVAMTGGTIQMAGNDTTQFPAATAIVLKGGTAQMDTPTAADFATPFIVEEDGGTLRSLTNDWNLSGAVTLARTTPTGGELKLAGTTNNELKGNITGDGVITKQEAGTWTLSGTNDYTGATTVEAGTLAVTGTLYNGLSAGTLAVQDGASLNFTGAGTLGLQDASTLTLDLHQNATFTPQAGGFGLTNLNLLLQGSYTNYNKAFIESVTASQLNSLVVAQGTPFALTMDRTGGTIAGGLTLTTTANLSPMDLSITLTGDYSDVATASVIDVIVTGTGIASGAQGWENLTTSDGKISVGNIDTSAATFPTNFILDFYYGNNKLYGEFTDTTPPPPPPSGGTNPGAMDAIYYATNPTGDTKIAQDAINAATTDEEKDQITQQFTPSMALAQAAQSVQTSSQLLQTVGQQLTVPWDSGYDGGVNMLRANNGRHSCGRDINSWFQGFGYAGEQAVKDDFAGYNNSGWGVAVGLDKAFTSRSTLGLAYGYSQTALNSTPFISGSETPSSVNTNGHSLVGYAMIRSSCDTFFAFKAGSTWYAVDGVRRPFASDPNRIYTYETDANTWYLQATLGWQWLQRPSFSLTPKGKLAYFNYSQSAYLENRPGLAPSSVDAYSNGYTQADLLLDFQLFFSDQLTLNTSVGYRGLVGAEGAVMTSAADGVSYNVNGVSAAEHQFVLDIGSVFEINRNALLITEYNYRVGEGSYLHGGTGSLVLTF